MDRVEIVSSTLFVVIIGVFVYAVGWMQGYGEGRTVEAARLRMKIAVEYGKEGLARVFGK